MLPSEYLEKGWTRGALARTHDGRSADRQSSNAVKWCMTGAMIAAYEDNDNHIPNKTEHCLRLYNIVETLIYIRMTSKPYNIIQRFKNRIKYKKTKSLTIYWNDNDCKHTEEAIEIMQNAEKIIGMTKESMQPKIKSSLVDMQIEEIMNQMLTEESITTN